MGVLPASPAPAPATGPAAYSTQPQQPPLRLLSAQSSSPPPALLLGLFTWQVLLILLVPG